MQMHELVLKMRESLLQRGITLGPEVADGHQQYEREGSGAWQAWQAFRAVAAEPAYDPVEIGGEMLTVIHVEFELEAGFSKGWSLPGGRDVGEHYSLSITRLFEIGEYGGLRGLALTIRVSAADELRDLHAELDGGAGDAADIRQWLDEVEADPAFQIPMTRHRAEHFAFGVVSIG